MPMRLKLTGFPVGPGSMECEICKVALYSLTSRCVTGTLRWGLKNSGMPGVCRAHRYMSLCMLVFASPG